ncbi:MAG: transposase, partial [Holosporaceae bacterium]
MKCNTLECELKKRAQEGVADETASTIKLGRKRLPSAPEKKKRLPSARLRGRRLDRDFALKEWVLDRIIYDLWSPEQISGFLKHRQSDIKSISVESIYSWIYDKKQRDKKIWRHLCRRKAKRTRRWRYSGGARISDRVSIHDRPQDADSKQQFGNWEGD